MVNFSVSIQGWGKMEDKIKLNWESGFGIWNSKFVN